MEKFKRLQNIFKGDRIIWIVFFLLCLVSVIEVYSSAARLGYRTGNYWFHPTYHTVLLLVGFLCMLVVLNIQCRYFKVMTPLFFVFSVFLLVLVYFFGTKENDAARWIRIGFIPIQPSEIAKGTLVLTTAHILSQLQTPDGVSPKAFKYIMMTSAVLIGLVLPENFSTAALMGVVVFIMMFVARVSIKNLLGLFVAVVATIGIAVMLVMLIGQSGEERTIAAVSEGQAAHEYAVKSDTTTTVKKKRTGVLHRMDLWKARIETFLESDDVPPEEFDMENKEQEARAYIAIASSDVIGRGPGRSVQRDLLPLAFSDFIYAIIFEEFGLFGGALVAFLYIILLFRTGIIARQCENTFPALLAMGLALMIVVQALFNMCVAVGLAPVTGQPLPLISKGGTSGIINCIYIGVILSVSRTAKKRMSTPEAVTK
ncbi:MAG: FtsW/RodA/SpoVE family cell cycle protein [Prevotella sp.]|nr:FtsW/RodA/SpoVE family cell cycle protein [Prevotella sp.]